MIRIKEAIIVEGKYDRMRLIPLFDTAIIETGGFRVFSDKEKRAVIQQLAKTRGIVLLTDSDGAGLVIRNYLKGAIASGSVKQAYVPQIEGKERRKEQPSKQGLLGVEGMTDEIIINAVLRSGAEVIGENVEKMEPLSKADLYELGLTGQENSAQRRKELLKKLGFPQYMTTNAMLSALSLLYTKEDLLAAGMRHTAAPRSRTNNEQI
ncbi:MAG: DUF4093 domain-containing protein [Clostridia bacterium]|nr:DUF4093 domain-containing protein [Clostridia bacterium]